MKRILLVEDDPFLVDIYTTKLKEAGFLIELATDGQQCLKKIEEKIPDLLILDIVLPQIDGWEVLRKIRAQERYQNLKVVILSNLSQKAEVEKGVELGATKYFIKAYFTPSQVIEEIKKILNAG